MMMSERLLTFWAGGERCIVFRLGRCYILWPSRSYSFYL